MAKAHRMSAFGATWETYAQCEFSYFEGRRVMAAFDTGLQAGGDMA
jgi:hypothetical protein